MLPLSKLIGERLLQTGMESLSMPAEKEGWHSTLLILGSACIRLGDVPCAFLGRGEGDWQRAKRQQEYCLHSQCLVYPG